MHIYASCMQVGGNLVQNQRGFEIEKIKKYNKIEYIIKKNLHYTFDKVIAIDCYTYNGYEIYFHEKKKINYFFLEV